MRLPNDADGILGSNRQTAAVFLTGQTLRDLLDKLDLSRLFQAVN